MFHDEQKKIQPLDKKYNLPDGIHKKNGCKIYLFASMNR